MLFIQKREKERARQELLEELRTQGKVKFMLLASTDKFLGPHPQKSLGSWTTRKRPQKPAWRPG